MSQRNHNGRYETDARGDFLVPPIYPRSDADHHVTFGPRPMDAHMGELPQDDDDEQAYNAIYDRGWADRGRADKLTRRYLVVFVLAATALVIAILHHGG